MNYVILITQIRLSCHHFCHHFLKSEQMITSPKEKYLADVEIVYFTIAHSPTRAQSTETSETCHRRIEKSFGDNAAPD